MNNSQKEKLVEKIACLIDEAFGARVINDGDLDPIYELIEGVQRQRYARQVGKQASCARREAPPVPDYERARKLIIWGGEG